MLRRKLDIYMQLMQVFLLDKKEMRVPDICIGYSGPRLACFSISCHWLGFERANILSLLWNRIRNHRF